MNKERKQVLHGLCSPTTGKTGLLQAVRIQLLSLHNESRDLHRPASFLMIGLIREGCIHPKLKFGVSSSKIAVFRNVVTQSETCNLLCCWL